MSNILIISMILSCASAYSSNIYIIVDIQMTNMTKCIFTLNRSIDRSNTIVIGPINCDDYVIGDVVCVYNHYIETCDHNKGHMAVYVIVAIVMVACMSIILVWVLNLRHNYIVKHRRTRAVIIDISESYENEQCPICIEYMVDNVCKVKCNHKYHRICIMPWLEINNTCPVCREPLF